MVTLVIILGCAVLLLIVMAKVPGVEHLVKPIIEGLSQVVKLCFVGAWVFGYWTVQRIWRAHMSVFKNTQETPQEIDPSYTARKTAK